MARQAKSSPLTNASFIAHDDDALGPNADYEAYLSTFDEGKLDLQSVPTRYYVRGMDTMVGGTFQEFLQSLSEEQTDRKKVAINEDELSRAMVEHCLIGCDEHQYVKGVGADGKREVGFVKWRPGDPEPVDVKNVLAQDRSLMVDMLKALVGLAALTDAEKKSDPRV